MEDNAIKFPNLERNQVAVLQIDIFTGIVLLEDGTRYLGKGKCYIVFDDISLAEKYSYDKLAVNNTIEFHIFNYKKEELVVIKDNNYIKRLLKINNRFEK